MWPACGLLAVGSSVPHLVLRVDDMSGPWWGNVAAVAMALEWLCIAGLVAALLKLPEALLYGLVGKMDTGRAVVSCAGANFVGGVAAGLTLMTHGPGWWQWCAGLGALLGGELVVAWIASRRLPARLRLMAVLAAANLVAYVVLAALSPAFV